jgi:aldehyde dehydrogenase (NAD+)
MSKFDLQEIAMEVLKALGIADVNAGAWTGSSEWVPEQTGDRIKSYNPATGEVLAKVISASPADFAAVMRSSVEAFLFWRNVPAPKRGELIRLIGQRVREQKDLLGTLISLEVGKIKAEGDGEVQEVIDMADFAVGQARMLYGLTMHSERESHRMYEQWHPLGPTAIITAFNFPMAVWAWNAFLAVICGNSVIWKPSPKTPLCAIALQRICQEVMTETGYQGVFNLLITNDNQIAAQLVEDPRIPLVSFTGSSGVGRQIAETTAHRFGKSLLELSGNNAIIIDELANLDLAIPAVVFGAVGTAGQRCTTTRRLFIHQKLFEDVVSRLKKAYQQVHVGNPLDADVLMGPLIDEASVASYEAAIQELKSLGATIVIGGEVLKGFGNFVAPTLVIAQNDWPLVQRETFAPILYLIPFETIEEAISLQNAVPYGLSSAIFTENLKHSELFLSTRGSDCGIANVNIGTSGAEIGGAFGGEKETGGGREAGSDAWKSYMRRQTVTINWGNKLPLAQGIEFEL